MMGMGADLYYADDTDTAVRSNELYFLDDDEFGYDNLCGRYVAEESGQNILWIPVQRRRYYGVDGESRTHKGYLV